MIYIRCVNILQAAIGYDNNSFQSRFESFENLQWQYNAIAERQKSLSPPNSTQSFQRFGLRGSFYENVKY